MTQRFFFLLKRLKSLPWISGHFRILKSVTIRIAMQLALIYFKCFLRHSFFLCCLDWPQSSQFISIHQHSGWRSCTFSFHFFLLHCFVEHLAKATCVCVAKATCVWPRLQTLNFLASFPCPPSAGTARVCHHSWYVAFGTKPRTSSVRGKHSNSWATCPVLLTFYFETESPEFLRMVCFWTCSDPRQACGPTAWPPKELCWWAQGWLS